MLTIISGLLVSIPSMMLSIISDLGASILSVFHDTSPVLLDLAWQPRSFILHKLCRRIVSWLNDSHDEVNLS